ATINSFGVLGGIVGPNILGFITNATGSLSLGLVVVAVFLLGGSIASMFLQISKRKKNKESLELSLQ
ncbi:MAG TPA: hypothetical protein VGW31_07305, partial [Hanamia sp.]|nr:hypothetical protein [Hanamia sp.]